MSFNLSWHASLPDVLVITIGSPVTMTEIIDIVQQESAQIENSERPVHTIFELGRLRGAPPQALSHLADYANTPAIYHSHAGLKIAVNPDHSARTIIDCFSRLYRPVHIADSMAQAEQIIMAQMQFSGD